MRRVNTGVASAVLVLTVLATGTGAGATSAAHDGAGPSARSQVSRAAPTATTIGSTAGPIQLLCTGLTLAQTQTGPGEPGYSVPTDGVITSYSTKANANDDSQIRMVVFGTPAGSSFPVAAKTPFRALIASTVNTFEVRVPVRAGWLLGAGFLGTGAACLRSGTAADLVDDVGSGSVDTDPSVTLAFLTAGGLLNISAVLEPDVDGDGFGDVSQDGCPVSALAQAACPAPETTITKAPKAHSSKRKVKLAFSSSVPGSLFLVTVDRKQAVPSLSPFVRKLGYGRHTITVQAVSPLSPVDPTPSTISFKIKKKKKKRH